MCKEVEGRPNLTYYPSIFLMVRRKASETLTHDSQSPQYCSQLSEKNRNINATGYLLLHYVLEDDSD